MSTQSNSHSNRIYKPFCFTDCIQYVTYFQLKDINNVPQDSTSSNTDRNPPCPEKIFRKYFGRKNGDVPRFQAHYRRHARNHCKNLKKLNFSIPFYTKPFSRPWEHFTLLRSDHKVGFDKLTFNKVISSSRHLQTLKAKEEGIYVSLKSVKKLKMLRSLALDIQEQQIWQSYNSIPSLKGLSQLSLVIRKDSGAKQQFSKDASLMKKFSRFYNGLLALPDLTCLKLELQEGSVTCRQPGLVEDLLANINHNQLKLFKIQVRQIESGALNVEKFEKTLSKIDFLSLRMINKSTKFIIFDGISLILPGTMYTEGISPVVDDSHKALDMHFTDVLNLDMSSIISKCTSLRSLGLHFGHKDSCFTIPCDLGFTDMLRDLTLSFESLNSMKVSDILLRIANMLKKTQSIENLSLLFIFSKVTHDTLATLGVLHRVLSLSKLKSYTFQFRERFKFRSSSGNDDVLEKLAKQLMEFKSLESLKIEAFVERLTSLHEIKTMLESLGNLQKLNLSLKSDPDYGVSLLKFYFPFDKLSNLKELRLRLKFPLMKDCSEHFIKNLPSLKDLEILEIMEGNISDIELELFCGMLRELVMTTNIKEIIINAKIMKNEDFRLYCWDIDREKHESLNVSHRLQEEVKNLFYANLKLQRLHVYYYQYYDINYRR